MLEKRKLSTAKYIVAGVLTLLIFSLGIMLGLIIEQERIGYIRQQSSIQKLEFSSLQIQYAYLDQLGSERDCGKLVKTFDQSINNLETARRRLVDYSQNTQTNKDEFDLLRRDYMLSQIQYWLFSKKVKQLCGAESASILYFYSTNQKCPDCAQQEFVLTYLKKKFGDKLLNFALDSEYTQEPMIQLLLSNYEVDTFPTLIIEDSKIEGFVTQDRVLSEICSHMGDNVNCREGLERINFTE